MKNFAQVMGLLVGSTWAHTYLNTGQAVPSPRRHQLQFSDVNLSDSARHREVLFENSVESSKKASYQRIYSPLDPPCKVS